MVHNPTLTNDAALESARTSEWSLNPDFWNACAGGMVQMPQINSKVFYFPQGHAELVKGDVDFGNKNIKPYVLCSTSDIKYLADPETDEVYAKIRFNPISEHFLEDDEYMSGICYPPERPKYFVKTLSQTDASNGGGFSVPRQCADSLFPPLDYSVEMPTQNIYMTDVHGKEWKFRHIFSGKPRRHLFTTGWNTFANSKYLVAGDTVVLMKGGDGKLLIGTRRARRGIGKAQEYLSFDNKIGDDEKYAEFFRECQNESANSDVNKSLSAESCVEAATLASSGQSFDVVYYPRGKTPEFFVKATTFRDAMKILWQPGMSFKMAIETDDSSRISWCLGKISAVQVVDIVRWPNSPWRLLQVEWEEPHLLQHANRVSPWSVELIYVNSPTFSLPIKKMRFSQHQDRPLLSQFQMSPFYGNLNFCGPLFYTDNNIPVGIQGARHPSSSSSKQVITAPPPNVAKDNSSGSSFEKDNESCLLNVENINTSLKNKAQEETFRLFGQVIHTEKHSRNKS